MLDAAAAKAEERQQWAVEREEKTARRRRRPWKTERKLLICFNFRKILLLKLIKQHKPIIAKINK